MTSARQRLLSFSYSSECFLKKKNRVSVPQPTNSTEVAVKSLQTTISHSSLHFCLRKVSSYCGLDVS